ncbi:S1 family peptidase [Streptomyces sp. SAI-133]|uniref:S1 family peptidase n=1 Tax=Streptomyces sp. SAI-133 TaxID=2940547 RepID=UPI0024757398|nr:S1 family peptidase [Streptomyces sp. SAI-133]
MVLSAGALSGSTAQAVGGDAAADGAYTFSAKIDVGGGARSCSGTLLNNQWMITAASCFTEDPTKFASLPTGAPALKSTATIGRTNLSGTAGEVRQITQLIPRTDRDLVLAKLNSPVYGVSFLHATTTAPATGETLKGAGYGRTKDTWVPNQLHTASYTAGTIEATGLGVDGTPVCKGDTGGPVLREKNGRPELAAIVTNSWQGGCLGTDPTETRTGAAASRVDDIRAWLTENTASTLNTWNLQMVTNTSTGLYHGMRNSNGDWTGFGDVEKAAGSVTDVAYAADAAIKGKNYVFAVGGDGHLYGAARRATGGWDTFRDMTTELGEKASLTRVAVTSTGPGLALVGLAGGRVYHATMSADETWSKWGDATAKLGTIADTTQLTVSQTSGGNTHVGIVAGGKAYHGLRREDGTWSTWGNVTQFATGIGTVGGMAFAGIAGDLQVILTSTNGINKHGIRATDGSWSNFGSLSTKLGTDTAASVDAAAVAGEFQAAIVTTDGKVKHALRHADGKWDAPEQLGNIPGIAATVAVTGSAG